MKWIRNWVGLALLAVAGSAGAEPENITLSELALTHPICYHVQAIPVTGWTRLTRESPQSAYWNQRIGGQDMLWGMHHYCWALIHLRRAQAPGIEPRTRKYLREVAISDLHYVVREANKLRQPSSFVMLPELYYRIGDTHALLGNTAEAMVAFEQSRAVKPDYWPPYLGQAQMFEKAGMRKEARRLLEQGLQIMPGEPNLSAAYKRVGGDPSAVKPLQPPATAAAETAEAAASAAASAPQ
jgi:tetratricopeptide (TPR) repeat protein